MEDVEQLRVFIARQQAQLDQLQQQVQQQQVHHGPGTPSVSGRSRPL